MLYNYIFIFDDIGYTKAQFYDLEKSSNAQFIPLALDFWGKNKKNILNFLCHVHHSPKLNYPVSLPFRSIWNKKLFSFSYKSSLDKNKPFCFIIQARLYEKYYNFLINYLRKNNQNCIIILYFTDLLINHHFNFNKVRNNFDAVLSFEKDDANRYGLIHYDEAYSKLNAEFSFSKSDVFFIGKAKNRLKKILGIYERLTDNGLKCSFYVTGVQKKEQFLNEKIHYIDYMDYNEILKHVLSTNCILEILQGNGKSPTLRAFEAVCYNRKLLTNCFEIIDRKYYNPKYISIYKDIESIDIDFIKKNSEPIDYNFSEKLSPLEMIKNIDENINLYIKGNTL